MVLDNYRATLDWWLIPLARSFRHVHPDVFTWLSLLCAIVGGLAFWQSGADETGLRLLGAAWLLVLLNSILDLLDGKVAHMVGKATPRGDYLDHAIDRFSDAVLILGLAFSPFGNPKAGAVALLGTLLASYMGTQAQAVGMRRNYGGLLGRADRMVLLLAIPLVEIGRVALGYAMPFGLAGAIEAMLWYFGIVGGLTAIQRFVVTLRGFGPDGRIKP